MTWTVRADGFPGGDVDLGEVPASPLGGRIAHWYVPSSQGTVPLSLYYDLGRPPDVETAYLWWQTRSDRTTEHGLPTDLDIDFLPLGADQPEGWDLATLQAVTGCRYDPSASCGEWACPFTTLYWDFLARHRTGLSRNPRMQMQLRNLARKSRVEIAAIRRQADAVRGERG